MNLPLFKVWQSHRQQVAHALRAALVAGELKPGTIYSAPTLAEKFVVSATPVRKAMLDLAKEGVVEAVRNMGFRVTELSDQELDDITSIRMLIEVPTVEDIARYRDAHTAPAVELLRSLAREIETHAAGRDLIRYVEADRQFHLGMLALAGNLRLVEVVDDLRARSRLYGLHELATRGEVVTSSREHEKLVDLVISGDVVAAGKLMSRHIGHVRGACARAPDPSSEPLGARARARQPGGTPSAPAPVDHGRARPGARAGRGLDAKPQARP